VPHGFLHALFAAFNFVLVPCSNNYTPNPLGHTLELRTLVEQ
jgi:hypothetical protein